MPYARVIGVENATLRSWAARYGRAGDETERYGTTVTAFGNEYVRGTLSHFGGAVGVERVADVD